MAHILKDSMGHYAIEISRRTKRGAEGKLVEVTCVIRHEGEVEFKRYPLNRTIDDASYHSGDGTYAFDERWQPANYSPDLNARELAQAVVGDLKKAIDSFLSGNLPVSDKARRMLEALRENPTAIEPLKYSIQPTEGEDEMVTKKAKTKKAPKEKVPRKAKFAPDAKIIMIAEKNFHEGSARGKCFAVIQKHKELTVAEYLKHCSGREIKKAQALSCLAKLAEPEQKVQTVKVG